MGLFSSTSVKVVSFYLLESFLQICFLLFWVSNRKVAESVLDETVLQLKGSKDHYKNIGFP